MEPLEDIRSIRLTDDDLARSAKDLPLKVIRRLGHQLHRQLNTGGNWEILAEELGYEYDDIKRLTAIANIRQEVTPGELLLREWADQPSSGHTLFVLHNALCRIDRLDCAEYMTTEVLKNVIYMDLMVCVKDESRVGSTKHFTVRTRSDSTVLESLQNVLAQPVQTNYKLLDLGASWRRTLAKEYKGRQLLIQRTSNRESMGLDQDPTVDSSMRDCVLYEEQNQSLAQQEKTPSLNRTHLQHLETTAARYQQHVYPDPRQSLQCHGQNLGAVCQVCMKTMEPMTSGLTEETFRKTISLDASMNSIRLGASGLARPVVNCTHNPYSVHKTDHQMLPSCIKFQRQYSKQNNLNSGVSNLPVLRHIDDISGGQQLNICDVDHKIKNTCITLNLSNESNVRYTVNQPAQALSIKAIGDKTEVTTANDSPFVNDEIMTDSECKDFGDFSDNLEYNGHSRIERNKMDNIGSAMCNTEETLASLDSSVKLLKQSEEMSVSSGTTTSSESDKEFVNMKLDSLEGMPSMSGTPFHTRADHNTHISEHENVQHLQKQCVEDDFFYEKERMVNCPHDTHHHVRFDLSGTSADVSSLDFDSIQKNDLETGSRSRSAVCPQSGSYPYIDFNDFPQTSPSFDPAISKLRLKIPLHEQFSTLSRNDVEDGLQDCSKAILFDRKTDSSAGGSSSGRSAYERLQRHVSCPTDSRVYEGSDAAVPTIADVFSPIGEGRERLVYPENVYETRVEDDSMSGMPEGNFTKCLSLPAARSVTSLNTGTRPYRHTFTNGQQFLPECPASENLEEISITSMPPPSPHRMSKVTTHPYKIVVGDRPRKWSLDGSLSNDRLFSYYNNRLREELAWSPLETEYTVERTMTDVMHQDGFYCLWYNRTKKNLMITISNRGKNVHIRVRTKVLENHLHFFIVPGCLFRDVLELIHHYMEQGLSLNTNSQEFQRRLLMRCPVIVQYGRKPAVCV